MHDFHCRRVASDVCKQRNRDGGHDDEKEKVRLEIRLARDLTKLTNT